MTVYELVVEGRQGGEDMLNVIHYDDGGSGPPDWADVAAIFQGHIEDHLTQYGSSWVTWTGITVREDAPGSVGVFYAFPGGTIPGDDTSGDQVAQVAVLVRKRSLGTVRPVLGWAFQGGITVHGTTAVGQWENAIRTEVAAFWEDIRVLNVAGPVTLNMVIKASNPSAPNTQAYSVVNSVQADPVPRTLRRRRINVGS